MSLLSASLSGVSAQSDVKLDFIARIQFSVDASGCSGNDPTGGSDVWGYTAGDGSEYAIMGVKEGVAFVSVPEMVVIGVVPGPQNNDCYYHRDIKTYQHYAYIVAEMSGINQGTMIVDLQYLPDSVHYVGSYRTDTDTRSHNLSLDVNTGHAYLVKQNYSGVRIVSLADPENPQEVGQIFTGNCHDVYARNDTVYISEGYLGSFSIWEVADKSNPFLLARITVPDGGYAHNAWPTDNGKYLMTTEETTNKTVKLWDIRDMSNISLAGEYLGANRLAHNAHIMRHLAIISHYTYGVAVVDLRDPANPREVAHYDTYPASDVPGFRGCWGAYPFSAAGYIYTADIEGYLTVLKLVENPLSLGPEGIRQPETFRLAQNYPNPFNPRTTISYSLAKSARVMLKIYSALGKEIRTLVNETQAAGEQRVAWDGRDNRGRRVTSGVYVYRLQAGSQVNNRKMVLLR